MLLHAALFLTCVLLSSCDRKTSDSAARDASTEPDRPQSLLFEGTKLTLPPGWSGGQSDAGGYEFTDGSLALMIGRHPLSPDDTLEGFAAERGQALASLGELKLGPRRPLTLQGRAALVMEGRSTEGVAVRLLLVRLDSRHGLSLLLVADAASEARLDRELSALTAGLRLPAL